MSVIFTDEAWNEYLYWQAKDKRILKKINNLIKSIQRDGELEGIGKPELLKHDMQGLYSRRIDEYNRLVYSIDGTLIQIEKCKGHYND